MFHQAQGHYNSDGTYDYFNSENRKDTTLVNNTFCTVERLDYLNQRINYLIQLQVQTNEMLYQLLNKKE